MNTTQIKMLLDSHPTTKPIFKGVFPSDMLPRTPKTFERPCGYVVNSDESDKPGKHWLAFFFPQDGPPEYFDSYGLPPSKTAFLKFLKTAYQYNPRWIQSVSSAVCGQYVIFFLLKRSENISFKDIVDMFTEDTIANDVLVNKIIEKTFSVDLDVFDHDFVSQQIATALLALFQ